MRGGATKEGLKKYKNEKNERFAGILKTEDILGKETNKTTNKMVIIYIYDNGEVIPV